MRAADMSRIKGVIISGKVSGDKRTNRGTYILSPSYFEGSRVSRFPGTERRQGAGPHRRRIYSRRAATSTRRIRVAVLLDFGPSLGGSPAGSRSVGSNQRRRG